MSVVYFAELEGGPIKVGHTVDLDRRLAEIQLCSPGKVNLIGAVEGDRRTEAYFHRRFAEHRAFGEWYQRHCDVSEYINRVVSDGPAAIPEAFRKKAEFSRCVKRDLQDILASALNWIEEIGSPAPFDEKITVRLKRVADSAGVSPRAVRAIWYGEATSVTAHVYVGLKECFEAKMARELGVAGRAGTEGLK
jgi:hypothetical protein